MRLSLVLVAASVLTLGAGCANCGAEAGPGPRRDTGVRDAGDVEAGMVDTGPMIMVDAGPGADAGPDTGPPMIAGTCEPCDTNADCGPRAYCVNLAVGGRACVPGCNPDIPDCPRAFSCTLDISSGVDATVCLPIGGPCCVDEDADTYGGGVGCVGNDCDDTNEMVNPGMPELCNGIDDDCDLGTDEPPTDCSSGRCYDIGDGTYEAINSGTCMAMACAGGSTTPCGLYTCEDGGAMGTRCARACSDMGADVDTYCIAPAHCDSGACLADLPNGDRCDEHSDCTSGNCTNGFCCDFGRTCCNTVSDCPGAGGVGVVCTDPTNCQGSRGTLECNSFACDSMTGIPDDSGCTATTMARDCGLYAPAFCTGAVDQPPPTCRTSCTTDADCILAAHCELGVCAPDRPPGGSCTRSPDCMDGLFCVDSVCCNTTCTGSCEACDLPGSVGACTPVAALTDPDNECAGFSCSDYYIGFDGARGDACYFRDRVDDAAAACSGGGACLTAADLCPMEPPGMLQIDCNDACQTPSAGSCNGMTPGACADDPPGSQTCGTGACLRTTPACNMGAPVLCMPGMPSTETCNGIDDNCDGTVDEGTMSLCPPTAGVTATMCTPAGTCAIASCAGGRYDIDGRYDSGCECIDEGTGNTCGSVNNLGIVGSPGAASATGTIPVEGISDYYYVQFPLTGPRQFGGGTPAIRLTMNEGGVYRIDVSSTCGGGSIGCAAGTGVGITEYTFVDDASVPGTNQYSTRTTPWPSEAHIRVYRTTSGPSCARYQLSISR